MDEITRALSRRYHRDQTPESAAPYIKALERTWGGASEPSLLLDIWGSLILGLFDPEGVNLAVYDSLMDLTRLLFGEIHSNQLFSRVDAINSRFFLPENSESWFDTYLLNIGYQCAHGVGCVDTIHKKCQAAVASGAQCTCPGCYEYFNDIDNKIYWFCWHHYQILQSAPAIGFQLDYGFRNSF